MTATRGVRTARASLGAALLALALLTGCTGTVTEALPTVLVVVRETAPAPVLALVAVDLSPTARGLRVIAAAAHTFAAGAEVLALDATPRDAVPTAAWTLVAAGDGSVALQRFDLTAVVDAPGATVPLASTRALVDAAGAWAADLEASTASPAGCLRQLVVGGPPSAPERYVALWDACPGGLAGDSRIHVVDLTDAEVTTLLPSNDDPVGLRPGVTDAATFTTVAVEIGVGGGRTLQTRRFDAPATPTTLAATLDGADDLLDLAVARGAWWALVRPTSGDPQVRVVAPDGTTTSREALAGALRIAVGTGPGVVAFTPSQAQVLFDEAASPETFVSAVGVGDAPDAVGVAIEANDYAVVAATSGALCALDARVPATNPVCEFTLPSSALPAARFLTWTYAAPSAP
ncbi:MAG: hypothetical protein P1P87_09070 [Trueperaceae bacterium]|nr:hypothetical protein [Trueperaceae bacterium]